MSDLENALIIHVFGETDYTSFLYPKKSFGGQEAIFGTPRAEVMVKTVGALLGFDNWETLREKSTPAGASYEDALSESVLHLMNGADDVNFALENDYNIVLLGVFRGPDGAAGEPAFSARVLGVSRTSSADVDVHAGLARDGVLAMAPMLRDEIAGGTLSKTGIVAEIISTGDGAGLAGDDAAEAPLPNMVAFHETVTEKGLETVVLCACEPELAAAMSAPDSTLAVGLVAAVIPTPHGPVGYWLWQVVPGAVPGFVQEQFVDPHDFPNATYDRLKSGDEVRFLVVDRESHMTTRVVTLDAGSLGLEDFERSAIEAARMTMEGDFSAACDYVMAHYSVGDFLDQAKH